MPTSLVLRWKLASMQAPALMTRASSASDGCRSAVPATDAGVSESMVAMSGGWIGGMARGAGLLRALVRERTPGDHQPRLGSPVFAREPGLYPAPDHLDGHWPFLSVSHRHACPGCGG